jgi:hypothetical protein
MSLDYPLKKGYGIDMKNHCLTIRDRKWKLIARVVMAKNGIISTIQIDSAKCLKSCASDSSWL